MAHLIACIGSSKETWEDVNAVIKLGFFDKIYIIIDESAAQQYIRPIVKTSKTPVKIDIIRLNLHKPTEELVPELYVILKKHFSEDKIQDLDIAVNIASGTGKEHAIVISTLMKLGYGIRLVDLDKDGGLLEMM
jgi:hypothetical protein